MTGTQGTRRLACRSAALLLVAVVGGLPAAQPALAGSSQPFSDTDAHGYIGFCDKQGHPVTSGDVNAQPFVWKALSSVGAPDGYDAGAGKAELVAYQPREGVPPSEWSGQQLTGSSAFTSSAHPAAQATDADSPLLYFVQAFPPTWQGLVQLRMYFSGPGVPVHSAPYPATTIRVSGSKWSEVSGGTVTCSAGTARSIESAFLSKSQLKRLARTPSPAPNATLAASDAGGSGTDWTPILGAVVGVALLGATGGAWWWRRRAGRQINIPHGA